ncbi:MAG TPA: peptide chain release factor N(5)-glutamine methyltransferase [Sphingomonas sp.]|jgi:release factor glutamine methyltransferase|nr:peptide chain release factor N(5)-glutamine methyltransferase [Sphingomonas sp.]
MDDGRASAPRAIPTSIRSALIDAAAGLPNSTTPRLDAELLMAHALGIPRDRLLLVHLDDPTPARFHALLDRRRAGEPIAYIVGTRDFWSIDLRVGPGVLIPRPDSETLIEVAVAHFGRRGPRTILDLGTGSGALLLAALAEWPDATGVGIDASPGSVAQAQANADRLGLAPRARIVAGDWSGTGDAYDLVLCNPPYIAIGEPLARDVRDHEPHRALFAGADGLADYRRIAPLLAAQIAPGGITAIEIGHDQAAAVTALLAAQGLAAAVRRDLAGHDRCLIVSPHPKT